MYGVFLSIIQFPRSVPRKVDHKHEQNGHRYYVFARQRAKVSQWLSIWSGTWTGSCRPSVRTGFKIFNHHDSLVQTPWTKILKLWHRHWSVCKQAKRRRNSHLLHAATAQGILNIDLERVQQYAYSLVCLMEVRILPSRMSGARRLPSRLVATIAMPLPQLRWQT